MRRAAGWLLVALVATCGAGGPMAAAAAPDQAGGGSAVPHLLLRRQTPWVSAGGPFDLQVAIPGAPRGDEVVQAVIYEATGSRSDFDDEVAGEGLGAPLADTGPLTMTTSGDKGVVRARFATDGTAGPGTVAAPIDTAGVYPVEVSLRSADGTPLDRLVTHLVRLPDPDPDPGPDTGTGPDSAAPPLNLSVMMPVDSGPGTGPSGGRRRDPAGSERLGTLLDALTEHPDVPLTVIPTPDTVATLAGGPRLARLRRAVEGRQVLSSSYVPLDLAAWVAAGMQDDLARQVAAGDDTLADHLVDRPDRRTAVVDDTITPEALTRLRELGTDQVVIPAEALAPLDESAFPVTLGQTFEVQDSFGQTQRAAAADTGLRARLDPTDDPVLDASTLLADLAVLYFDRPNLTRGVTLTLPRVWEPDASFLDTLLGALETPGIIAPVTIDQLFARVPAATAGGENDPDGPTLVRTLVPAESPTLGGYPGALSLTRLTTHGFASFAGRDNPRTASMQRRMLVSGSADFDRSQRQAYLTAIGRQTSGATAAVRAPDRQTVTLTSRNGRIPLNLSNENLYDVSVRLAFSSGKLEFPEGDTVVVDLPRSSITPLEIDVRARSSGTFPFNVTVTSPDGVLLVATSKFTVRSTAVSNVGLVLSAGAGAFLAVWWASHFRRVRRARKLVAADEAGGALE